MNVYLDDCRPCPDGWVLVKSVEEAKQALQLNNVQKLSLDHDLGSCDDCYLEVGIDPNDPDKVNLWILYSGFKQMPNCTHFGTGYDLVLWMAEHGIWPAEKPTVHSANPVGRERMRGVIERYFPCRNESESE